MNLGQTATLIGQRLGIDTSSGSTRDGAAVRSLLTMRHDQLFRSFLWKDAIIEMLYPYNPGTAYVPSSNFMPTKRHMVLPPIFQLVLGARFGWRSLNVERPMFYYSAGGDWGDRGSWGRESFSILSAAVWEFDTPQNLTVTTSANADQIAGYQATLDELQADGVTITRANYALTTAGTAAGTTDRVDNLIIPNCTGTVTMNVGASVITTIAPGILSSPKCQRIQFHGGRGCLAQVGDIKSMSISILGKRNTPNFILDTDVPAINGLDGILVALVYYDFCQRDERGGTNDANGSLVEAVGPRFLTDGKPGGFLAKLIEEEVLQAAYNCRIIPDQGFGGTRNDDIGWGTKADPYNWW